MSEVRKEFSRGVAGPDASERRQNYNAWFTSYPSTHEKAGQPVEVVVRSWVAEEVDRLLADAEDKAYNQGYSDGIEDNRSGLSVADLEAPDAGS